MKNWNWIYTCLLISAIGIPSVLFHPSFNPISPEVWNLISEKTYGSLLHFQQPEEKNPSQVVIVEINDETLARYGWPLDRSYYVQFLERLETLGRPWLLSNLWFEPLINAKKSAIPEDQRQELDQQWAGAIKSYGRFIGSNLKIDADEELTTYQEETLLPRVLLRRGEAVGIPWFPLQLMDADPFVEGQKAFGFGPQMGSGIVHCAQFFLGGAMGEGSGALVASSAIWAAALATGRSIVHGEGFQWQHPDGDPQKMMRVDGRHCLTSPSMLTFDFLQKRQIEEVGFHEILDPAFSKSLAGKVVLLATTNGTSYVDGPGVAEKEVERKVHEHKLVARFLDGLLIDSTIRRPVSHISLDDWFGVAFALTMVVFAMWLPLELLIVAAFGSLFSMAAVGTYFLYQNVYLIPLHAAMTSLTAGCLLSGLYILARTYSQKAQMDFAKRLRIRLAQCNDLQNIEQETKVALNQVFKNASAAFDYDRDFYLASTNTEALLSLSAKIKTEDAAAPSALRLITSMGTYFSARRWFHLRVGRRNFKTTIAVNSNNKDLLGSVNIGLRYADCERYFVDPVISYLCEELSLHWYRVRMLVDQRVKEHKLVAEKTRGDVMSRFLSQAVLSKFSGEKSVDENLATVLTAKEGRAALLQADIRGYSGFAETMSSLETVHLLRSYYQNVVDAAQEVAQVKLIGDCIFLFIERGFGTKDLSPTDLMLQISAILVSDTLQRNRQRPGAELNFGIAIHYGDVVVGNLSSESCIDYTVIGPNVNQVARMEELTKHAQVQDLVGLNGILLSDDALQSLVKYKDYPFKRARLEQLGVSVRSFPDVKTISYLTAAEAIKIVEHDILKSLSYAERFAG